MYILFTNCLLIPLNRIILHSESVIIPRKRTTSRGNATNAGSRGRRKSTNRLRSKLWVYNAVAMTAALASPHRITFDPGTKSIGIDNRASACISYCADDFKQGTLSDTNKVIKGYGGTRSKPIQRGTLIWDWYDDQGKPHIFEIPNSYCDPDGGLRLLSPQHFAQATGQHDTAGEYTTGRKCVLFWNDQRNMMTVPIDKRSNVATFTTAPPFKRYNRFCEQALIEYGDDDNPLICQTATSVVEEELEA